MSRSRKSQSPRESGALLPPRSSAALLVRGLRVIALLQERPRQTPELASELGVSLATGKRILISVRAALRGCGVEIRTERRGRELWHSVPAGTLERFAGARQVLARHRST